MAEPLVPDALWGLIAPLLAERPPRPKGSRPPLDDRGLAARADYFVTGDRKHLLPLGCVEGVRIVLVRESLGML
jgi:hypothetical protein